MMLAIQLAAVSLSFSVSSFGAEAACLSNKLDRSLGKIVAGAVENFVTLHLKSGQDSADPDADPEDSESNDGDTELETLPVSPVPPVPPVPPLAPVPGPGNFSLIVHSDGTAAERELPRFTEHAKHATTVDLLHRIARTAGWSMTLVGSPKEKVDIDVEHVDPREALRMVLKQSGAMGVLKRDRLVVVASPEGNNGGMLVQEIGNSREQRRSSKKAPGHDMVRIFQGDITVPQGTVVQGDVVCIGGSIEVESGAVVQGDVDAILGTVNVDEGALVLGDAVAILGAVNVDRGAQVMGEHLPIGFGRIFNRDRHQSRAHSGFSLTHLGPFGLFPTLALFAVIYLFGLLALRVWPDRVRGVGAAMFEAPTRSFFVGFLCWLLLLPLVILLVISIVGIPLVPLLPVLVFLSIVLGISALALRIGESLPAGPGQRFVPPAALGMGIAVLLLIAFVPWLGVPLLALLQIFALGAAVGSRFGRALPPHAG